MNTSLVIPSRGLSIRPDPLSWILSGHKRVENRTWRAASAIGERIALHRSKKDHGIVALATIQDTVEEDDERLDHLDQGDYITGPWVWLLADIEVLPWPIWCKGKLGLWPISDYLQRTIHDLMKQGGKALA